MRKLFLLFFVVFCLFFGCKSSQDQIVAEVHNQKLYSSEVQLLLPAGLSHADSVKMVNHLIEDWIKKQLLIFEANKYLAVREKSFEKEIDNYKKDLLINAFFQKLTLDSTIFSYTEEELTEFMRQYEHDFSEEKIIVKLNYVKLAPNSKVLKPVRAILFNEQRRLLEKEKIEELCADSIEYFIEDHTWLFFDDIKHSLQLKQEELDEITDKNRYIERKLGNDLYLIVLLEKNVTPYNIDNYESADEAKSMIIQQKKIEYIDQYINDLYKKAIEENIIIR